jgi:Cu-Zn family superoxide dismutase
MENIMRQHIFLATVLLWTTAANATPTTVTLHKIDTQGVGAAIGTVTLTDGAKGLELTTQLQGLPPGFHGFHVHENPSCAAGEKDGNLMAGLAAGGHYDPDKTGRHLGPAGPGHKGDLPVLAVAADGTAKTSIISARLTLADIKGRSLMIHAESDNYGDKPGGARLACGIVN